MPIDQQIAVIQQNMFPIVMVQLALDYNCATSSYNYFCLDKDEEQYIQGYFPSFCYILASFHDMGQQVKNLRLSDVEVAFLCGLILVCEGN